MSETTIRDYAQHKVRCASLIPRDFCRQHGGDGSISGCPSCQGLPRRRICTCGLDALLAQPDQGETPKDEPHAALLAEIDALEAEPTGAPCSTTRDVQMAMAFKLLRRAALALKGER